jgi:hypothetical protein
MKKTETFYLVAKGGYVGSPIIKRFTVTPEEVADAMDEDDSLEEEDALQDILSETAAAYEQGFARTMIFTEKEFKKLFKEKLKITNL